MPHNVKNLYITGVCHMPFVLVMLLTKINPTSTMRISKVFALLSVAIFILAGVAAAHVAPGHKSFELQLQKAGVRTALLCPNKCLPAWTAFAGCLHRLDSCILEGCKNPRGHSWYPYAMCTDAAPVRVPPSPSPTPTGCTADTTDHFFDGEFGVRCSCPSLGVTFIHKASPNDVMSCMRKCFDRSDKFLEACHVYKRVNINGATDDIKAAFKDVGRSCCDRCGGSYSEGPGKPNCFRD